MKHYTEKYSKELIQVFSSINGEQKMMKEFLIDILTPKEFEDLALRWQIVKRLFHEETQRSIAKDLGLGIATVSRGSRELRNKKGGFLLVLKKIIK